MKIKEALAHALKPFLTFSAKLVHFLYVFVLHVLGHFRAVATIVDKALYLATHIFNPDSSLDFPCVDMLPSLSPYPCTLPVSWGGLAPSSLLGVLTMHHRKCVDAPFAIAQMST